MRQPHRQKTSLKHSCFISGTTGKLPNASTLGGSAGNGSLSATSALQSKVANADGKSLLSNAIELVKLGTAETDWLDRFRDSMLQAESFRACLTLGASWLCEWIDKELAAEGLDPLVVGGYRQFCQAQAEEMEVWQGEDEELWVWAWSAAGELLEFYELGAHWTDDKLVETFCSDCDDPEITDKESYARHLIVSALAFIHGWVSK